MWLRFLALFLNMIPGLVAAQGTDGAARRVESPVAGAADPRRPAEAPPPDFTSQQYIDSTGCVFLRTDAGWRLRLARDGAAICGWPPTLPARAADAGPAAEPRAAQIERLLTETIITNLQAGELVETPAPGLSAGMSAGQGDPVAAAAAPADPAASDPLGISRMMTNAPDLRRQLVGSGRAEGLCGLIGAGDSLGLCGPANGTSALAEPGRRAPATAGVVSGAGKPPLGDAVAGQQATAAAAASFRAPAPASTPAASLPPTAVATTPPPPSARAPVPASGPAAVSPATARPADKSAQTDAVLIPPGTRYLEVGAFKDPLDAHLLAQKLVGMGLPVVRSKPGQNALSAVMVGPQDDREAMVRMADRLRRAGFSRLVAR